MAASNEQYGFKLKKNGDVERDANASLD
jgi:hypothetical protein